MRILFSKTDALGDQLFASGFVRELLSWSNPDSLIWCVHQGNEAVSALFAGSKVFTPNTGLDSVEEARRLIDEPIAFSSLPWARVVFVPISINPYAPWPDNRDRSQAISWWLGFVGALRADVAIAGTIDLNWLDYALVAASNAATRAASQPHSHFQEPDEEVINLLRDRGVETNPTHALAHDPRRHELESFAGLLSLLTGKERQLHFSLDLPNPADDAGPSVDNKKKILVAPGSGDKNRVYPYEKMIFVVEAMHGACPDYEWCLLCGPNDREIAGMVFAGLKERHIPVTLAEFARHEIIELADALREAKLLICNETFVAHLAAFLGTPTVAIWGGGHWGRFLPLSGQVTILHAPMLCYHCQWACCFSQRFCISGIAVADVVNVATNMIERGIGPSTSLVSLVACQSPIKDRDVIDALQKRSHDFDALQSHMTVMKRWLDEEIYAKQHWENLFRLAEKQRDEGDALRLLEAAAKKEALKWAHNAEAMKVHWETLFRIAEKQRDSETELRLQEATAKEEALKWAHNAEAMKVHWETLFRMAEKQRDSETELRVQEATAKEEALRWARQECETGAQLRTEVENVNRHLMAISSLRGSLLNICHIVGKRLLGWLRFWKDDFDGGRH